MCFLQALRALSILGEVRTSSKVFQHNDLTFSSIINSLIQAFSASLIEEKHPSAIRRYRNSRSSSVRRTDATVKDIPIVYMFTNTLIFTKSESFITLSEMDASEIIQPLCIYLQPIAFLASSIPFKSLTGIHVLEGILMANSLPSFATIGHITFSNEDSTLRETSSLKYL